MSDRIDVGDIVRITNGDGFKLKPSGELFDPSLVELTLRTPDGDSVDLTADIQTDSEGLYYADYTAEQEGVHWFRWEGDSVVEQALFVVINRRVPEPGS